MSALVDLLLTQTDPVTAIVMIGLWSQLRKIRKELKQDMKQNKERIERIENGIMEQAQ